MMVSGPLSYLEIEVSVDYCRGLVDVAYPNRSVRGVADDCRRLQAVCQLVYGNGTLPLRPLERLS
jgi:hypothetical protein